MKRGGGSKENRKKNKEGAGGKEGESKEEAGRTL